MIKTAENPISSEIPLEEAIKDHIPSPQILSSYLLPGPIELERKHFIEEKQKLVGAKYILTRVREKKFQGKSEFVFVPPWHNLNSSHPQIPGSHYGQLAFEGDGIEPVIDGSGEIVGANLVLFPERMARFRRSISAIGMADEDTDRLLDEFAETVKLQAAILGEDVLRDKNGNPTRAYVRPTATRVGPFGVAPTSADWLAVDCLIWAWGPYLSKDAYVNGAIFAAFPDFRRSGQIFAKVAGNYSYAGEVGKRARALSRPDAPIHEAMVWGPYWINPETREAEALDFRDPEIAMQQILKGGILTDGPGEDLIFFDPWGTLFYQPKDTNILAGTTRDYIIKYLAPRLGVSTQERVVTIDDVRKRRVVSMCCVGNAVKFCGVKELKIFDNKSQLIDKVNFEISPLIREFTERFSQELGGKIPTSGPLLTPIDLRAGKKAREVLDKAFPGW